jgi:uncharacterized cupredoxin-like copper-binding protein
MIWRLWFVLMIVAVAGAWALAVPYSPATVSEAGSNIETYRQEGVLPGSGELSLSREVGHEVFELPAEDAGRLREALAAGGGMAGMAGMEMGEAAEGHGEEAMEMGQAAEGHGEEAMEMGKADEDHGEEVMEMAMPGPSEGAEHEEEAAEMAMPGQMEPEAHGAAESEAAHGGGAMAGMEEEAAGGHGGGGEMAGISVLALGSGEGVAQSLEGLAVDRSIELAMTEWGYDPPRLMVEAGEVVRLVVRNDGRLPHEFMLMSGAGMAAVNYRIERADWNLLEHEAIAEMPIVMPGDSFEVVARIHRPGTWMFMCMFPYHMQLGMMGMMMTEGASMDESMDTDDGMKM